MNNGLDLKEKGELEKTIIKDELSYSDKMISYYNEAKQEKLSYKQRFFTYISEIYDMVKTVLLYGFIPAIIIIIVLFGLLFLLELLFSL